MTQLEVALALALEAQQQAKAESGAKAESQFEIKHLLALFDRAWSLAGRKRAA